MPGPAVGSERMLGICHCEAFDLRDLLLVVRSDADLRINAVNDDLLIVVGAGCDRALWMRREWSHARWVWRVERAWFGRAALRWSDCMTLEHLEPHLAWVVRREPPPARTCQT